MQVSTRREILGSAALVGGWLTVGSDPLFAQQTPGSPQTGAPQTGGTQPPASTSGPYTLPPLPYGYADLEPHIDAQTMKLHHDIHHAAYVKGANDALAELETIRREGGDQIRRVRAVTDALSFNLSGHLLHNVFWSNMAKDGGGEPAPDSAIARMISRDFGSHAAFWGNFAAAAVQVQGSGWGILALEPASRRLMILQAEKHQNTGVWGVVPLLVLDVWEHAYYLSYQNRRADYIKAFANVIHWQDVEQRLRSAGGAA